MHVFHLPTDFMWPHDKSIAWLFIISQHPAKFGDCAWCGFGYTLLFICQVISRDHVIKGSYNNYIVKFDCYSPPGSRYIDFYLSDDHMWPWNQRVISLYGELSLIITHHTVKFDGCGGCRCRVVIVSIHQVQHLNQES